MKMKLTYKTILPLLLVVTFLGACKEDNPGVILDPPAVSFTDSTYIAATAEQPQDKAVLIEDYTGVRCKNCPKGHRVIQSLRTKFPGRVIALGIHAPDYQTFTTPFSGEIDMRVPYGTQILDIVGRATGLPYGTVDRVLKSGNSGLWETFTNQRFSTPTPVNLYIEHEYNDASRELKVKAKAVFTDTMATTPFFSIAIAESGIVSPQLDLESTNPGSLEPDYVHDHVLRTMPAFKEKLLSQGIDLPEKNRVVEKTFSITLKPEWKADNCEIMFFVHRDVEVIHAVEKKLK